MKPIDRFIFLLEFFAFPLGSTIFFWSNGQFWNGVLSLVVLSFISRLLFRNSVQRLPSINPSVTRRQTMTANEAASAYVWEHGSRDGIVVNLFDERGNPIVQRGYDLPDLYLDARYCLDRKVFLEKKGIKINFPAGDVERLRKISGF